MHSLLKYKGKSVANQKMLIGFELLQPLTAALSSTFTDWKVNIRAEFLTTLNLQLISWASSKQPSVLTETQKDVGKRGTCATQSSSLLPGWSSTMELQSLFKGWRSSTEMVPETERETLTCASQTNFLVQAV